MSRAQLTSTVEQNTGGAVSPYVAGKNFLINGNFDIWQRGTSGFSTTDSYTTDRWKVYLGGAGTVSQDTSLVATGSQYSARLTSNGAGFVGGLYQSIETSNSLLLSGRTVTLSGLIAGTSGKTANLQIATSTATDVPPFGAWTALIDSGALTVSSSFTKFSITATIPSSAKSVRIGVGTSGPLANTEFLTFAQIQLEIGSVATPFSRAGGTLSGELAACQRYYYRNTATGVYSNLSGIGIATSSTNVGYVVQMPVTMRTTPSTTVDSANIILTNFATNITINTVALISNQSSPQSAYLSIGTTGASGGTPYVLMANNNTNSYIGLSAEL